MHVEHLTKELSVQDIEQLVGSFLLPIMAKLQEQGKRCFVIHFATPPLDKELSPQSLQRHSLSFKHFYMVKCQHTLALNPCI